MLATRRELRVQQLPRIRVDEKLVDSVPLLLRQLSTLLPILLHCLLPPLVRFVRRLQVCRCPRELVQLPASDIAREHIRMVNGEQRIKHCPRPPPHLPEQARQTLPTASPSPYPTRVSHIAHGLILHQPLHAMPTLVC